jgi:tRNA-dihydrouridine synthase A
MYFSADACISKMAQEGAKSPVLGRSNPESDRLKILDKMSKLSHIFCIAPMMDWTDRHCRYFHRLITRHALLYTEMITAEAVLHGWREQLLGFASDEHPVALQLGGGDPGRLAAAAAIGEGFGYDEINLNCGCPSDRVQGGQFGACLMAEPARVGEIVAAMRARVRVPVTVKCRIGIDDQDSEADLERFATAIEQAGCGTLVVHARKAWLEGLSPKENRELPPLDHARVERLKAAHPGLEIVLNGGLTTLAEAKRHLARLDGVMLGRAAYQTPWLLAEVDRRFFGATTAPPSRADILELLIAYAERHLASGGRLSSITRHILGLYHGEPGARAFRRHLSENAVRVGAGIGVLREAIALVESARERKPVAA